jgi:hypothetical protein
MKYINDILARPDTKIGQRRSPGQGLLNPIRHSEASAPDIACGATIYKMESLHYPRQDSGNILHPRFR